MARNGKLRLRPAFIKYLSILLLTQANGVFSLSSPQPGFNLNSLLPRVSKAPKALEFDYRHLEINGMIWSIPDADFSVVVDPIASQLDFGIPWGYRANKKYLTESQTLDIIKRARPSHVLLSMGLDDHTHLPTLKKVVEIVPEVKFVVAPSAKDKISGLVPSSQIIVLKPGVSMDLLNGGNAKVTLRATKGALVGPPWQARENGWLLNVSSEPSSNLSVYYEPHADVVLDSLSGLQADIVISPVKEQSLPAQVPKPGQFTLVYGGKQTLAVADKLGASVVVPLGNGDLYTEGPLAGIVKAAGNIEEFEAVVKERNKNSTSKIRVERAKPGQMLRVKV